MISLLEAIKRLKVFNHTSILHQRDKSRGNIAYDQWDESQKKSKIMEGVTWKTPNPIPVCHKSSQDQTYK